MRNCSLSWRRCGSPSRGEVPGGPSPHAALPGFRAPARCRPPPGGLARGRRSKPSPRSVSLGIARFAVKMQPRREADSLDSVLARERRCSHRHRPAQRGERAYRQPRRSAGTAWNADLRSARAGLRPAHGASVSGGMVPLSVPTPLARSSQGDKVGVVYLGQTGCRLTRGGLGTTRCTIRELRFHDRRGVREDPIMAVSRPCGLRCRCEHRRSRASARFTLIGRMRVSCLRDAGAEGCLLGGDLDGARLETRGLGGQLNDTRLFRRLDDHQREPVEGAALD